jgi:hypothetical protein
MRRHLLLVIVALAVGLLPAAGAAQVRLLAGAGLSTPIGHFGDAADPGWHLGGGLQLTVPSIPVALRGDGAYHSFGQASPTPKTSMLSGALSLVVTLPGVGLEPYFLGGIGAYRTSIKGSDPSSNRGFHGAFGVNIGGLGFGGFAEVRLVSVNGDGGHSRFVTATVGVRL